MATMLASSPGAAVSSTGPVPIPICTPPGPTGAAGSPLSGTYAYKKALDRARKEMRELQKRVIELEEDVEQYQVGKSATFIHERKANLSGRTMASFSLICVFCFMFGTIVATLLRVLVLESKLADIQKDYDITTQTEYHALINGYIYRSYRVFFFENPSPLVYLAQCSTGFLFTLLSTMGDLAKQLVMSIIGAALGTIFQFVVVPLVLLFAFAIYQRMRPGQGFWEALREHGWPTFKRFGAWLWSWITGAQPEPEVQQDVDRLMQGTNMMQMGMQAMGSLSGMQGMMMQPNPGMMQPPMGYHPNAAAAYYQPAPGMVPHPNGGFYQPNPSGMNPMMMGQPGMMAQPEAEMDPKRGQQPSPKQSSEEGATKWEDPKAPKYRKSANRKYSMWVREKTYTDSEDDEDGAESVEEPQEPMD